MKKKNLLALFLSMIFLGFVGTSLADNNSKDLPIVYYEDYDQDEAIGLSGDDDNSSEGKDTKDSDLEKATNSIEDEISREEKDESSSESTGNSNSSQSSKDNFPYPAEDMPIKNQSTINPTSRDNNYLGDSTYGPIKGNRLTGVYHTSNQRDNNKISIENVTWFYSEDEAISKGYRHAQR